MRHARQILTLLGLQPLDHSSPYIFSSTAHLSSQRLARDRLGTAGLHKQEKRQRLERQANYYW